MKNTKLLPVVHPDIGQSLKAEILEREGNQYVAVVIMRLQEENPCIASFINSFSVTGPEDPVATAYCGIFVCRLLKSQAEADQLKKNLGL